jgi:hypothetical protein
VALGGVIGAGLRLFDWYSEDLVRTPFFGHEATSQLVSIAGFSRFCAYLWWRATRVPARESAPVE